MPEKIEKFNPGFVKKIIINNSANQEQHIRNGSYL